MNVSRCKIKILPGHRDDGTEFKGWYLGVLTAEKFRLTASEQKQLLSHFNARPANSAGEYLRRTAFRFYVSDKHDDVMRAWYWLADVDMVTKEDVQKWTAFLGKPAKAEEFLAEEVAPAKKEKLYTAAEVEAKVKAALKAIEADEKVAGAKKASPAPKKSVAVEWAI